MKVRIKVIPNSGEDEVFNDGKHQLIVRVKARAEKGKANAAVEKLLGKHFGKNARITSGFASRKKIVEIY